MKIVVAPQAFKGTASAADAAEAMRLGVVRAMPDACVAVIPIADGGGGTVDALVTATGGRWVTTAACDPMGRPIEARWGVLGDGETAVIEAAAASGLALLAPSERDPTVTTSRGTGDLIRAALDSGYRRILVGLGDSATNDAGVGMAQALGFRALDEHRDVTCPPVVPRSQASAHSIARAYIRRWPPHPLRRSATSQTRSAGRRAPPPCSGRRRAPTRRRWPSWTPRFAALHRWSKEHTGLDVLELPGAGAAGGLGAGLVAFCGASLSPGFEVVSAAVRLADSLAGADLVLTGEGRLDAQTRRARASAAWPRWRGSMARHAWPRSSG